MHPPMGMDDLEQALDVAAGLLRGAERVAVLTGSGVSAESGIATFRGPGGLWEGHPVEEVATPHGFQRDPALVWRFYNARRASIARARPNPGHYALAAMEQHWGSDRFTLATQNIDGLHRAAGNVHVLELHGNLGRVRCTRCTFSEDRSTETLPDLPHCGQCGHLLRPDVVWFYEKLPETVWSEASQCVGDCNCLLVVGTSAVVYPAAGLIDLASRCGAAVIESNLKSTAASLGNVIGLYGPSGQVLPQLVQRLGWSEQPGK
jgi:NAD-dependent deacetylase